MKQSMTITELKSEVARQALTREDFVVPQDSLNYGTGGNIGFLGRALPLSELSHRQLASALRFPFQFYSRMRRDHPDLHAADVNRLLGENSKPRMLRTLDGTVRAIVGQRFLRVDGDQLLEILVPELEGLGLTTESAHADGQGLFVKAFTPRVEEVAPGEPLRGGFLFSTSEVGQGKIFVAAMAEFTGRNTGIVVGSTLGTYQRRHAGPVVSVDEETGLAINEVVPSFVQMAERIRSAIRTALSEETFLQLLARLRVTRGMAIPGALDVEILAVRLRRRLGLSEGEATRMLEHLHFEDQTVFGLVQAISRTSHDALTYERATELEMLGGSLLDLTPRQWADLTELPATPAVSSAA